MPSNSKNIDSNKSCQKSFQRFLAALAIFIAALWLPSPAGATFLNLDSIARWGKFPALCVRTYRWGDRFFNGYDSAYVQGSGRRMNIKFKSDSWMDVYRFRFDNGYKMIFDNRPSTSAGLWLTYMAVSVGYDMNVSKFFNSSKGARKRWDFQFNCMLFGAEFYMVNNDVEMTINRIGYSRQMQRVNIKFEGFHSESMGVNLYYFFNHKHYSQAAAFAYSKLQVKSSGSLYAGLAFWSQKFDIDFSDVFDQLNAELPSDWDNKYRMSNRNYAVKLGYGYNWVFHRGWLLGVSEAMLLGARVGFISHPDEERTTFAMSNRLRMSLIYNSKNRRWFYGIICNMENGLFYDRVHTFLTTNISMEISAGFRFDIW